ncbi:glycerophosphodiester phosphodiesterase family protein [Paenibacillus qinlingensis]|uniref:Glycerophosphoryl diester phosphodiesterase n=1 Tax=Paenibacillus qinlingensis TaxID=1837343 RepID=A0ABU1P0P6_9BACL|nr:glycerophosphodiester phosphodiesterase family protein [Paenibacillus qinlingensis]MDR6553317.1 glycerophosphoryl diester phosphodiesterase [Paenibacillus qinlingensis]
MVLREEIWWKSVKWQAHQNSNSEMPENTLAAVNYAWELGGIPELDIRQTVDGTIVGLHDATPERTTNAPAADKDKLVSTLTYEQLCAWDAGIKFGEQFQGERIPDLEHIFKVLAEHAERELYLDYKSVDLESLAELIGKYGVARQLIFAHNDHGNCSAMKRLVPEVRTMLWISGRVPETLMRTCTEVLEGDSSTLDIIQLHLVDEEAATEGEWRYRVPQSYVADTLAQLEERGLELEVLPFHFADRDVFELLDMGIRRYAVDEPKRFVEVLQRYFE